MNRIKWVWGSFLASWDMDGYGGFTQGDTSRKDFLSGPNMTQPFLFLFQRGHLNAGKASPLLVRHHQKPCSFATKNATCYMSSKPFLGRIAGCFCRSSIFVGLRFKVHSTRIGGDFTQFFPGRILTFVSRSIWSAAGKNLGVLMMRWLDVCCYSYEASNSFCAYSIYLEHKWNMYIYYIYTLHDMNFPGVLHKFSPNKKMQKKMELKMFPTELSDADLVDGVELDCASQKKRKSPGVSNLFETTSLIKVFKDVEFVGTLMYLFFFVCDVLYWEICLGAPACLVILDAAWMRHQTMKLQRLRKIAEKLAFPGTLTRFYGIPKRKGSFQ